MTIILPANVTIIIESLTQAGYEAYAVGGCVRDSILLQEPNDWDITTSAKPEEMKAIFRRTVDTGIEHGTITVLLGDEAYEVTTYRIDGEYKDARHPEEVTFTSDLREDLLRRDFTINAMAYNKEAGLVDLYGGQEDLEQGVIRCVGDANQRFGEDALRMMRAVRFSAQLGFTIDEDTLHAIIDLVPNLEKVSAERIQVELVKLLLSEHPDRFKVFDETGLTAIFLPELMGQSETTRREIRESLLRAPRDKVIRLSILLYHLVDNKDPGKIKHLLKRLKFDNDTVKRVGTLTQYAKHQPELQGNEVDNFINVRREVVTLGREAFPDIFLLQEAISPFEEELTTERRQLYHEIYQEIIRRKEPLSIKELAVNGGDLIQIGVSEGLKIGAILNTLFDRVIVQPESNRKDELLAWTKKNLLILVLVCIASFSFVGCSLTTGPNNSESQDLSGENGLQDGEDLTDGSEVKMDDSLYVIMEKREDTHQLVVSKVGEENKRIAYTYGGYTVIVNRYGKTMSMDEVEAGQIVNIGLVVGEHKVRRIELSAKGWKVEGATGWALDAATGVAHINNRVAKWDDSSLCFGEGELMDIGTIDSADVVDVYGVDHQVLSVVLVSSHATINFSGFKDYIGGYLIIGNQVAMPVTEDTMNAAVPEGTYIINLFYKGSSKSKKVTINANDELAISELDFTAQEIVICKVTFKSIQEGVIIYVNGKLVDQTKPMELSKGAYTIRVEAPDYDTVNKLLVINSEEAVITVDMSVLSALSSEVDDSTEALNTDDSNDSTTSDRDAQLEEEHSADNYDTTGSGEGEEDSSSGDSDTEDTDSTVSQIIDAILGGN